MKRVKFHNYLGMDPDYSEKWSLKVSMIKYVKIIIDAFLEEIKSTSDSPSVDHLFKIRE